MTEHGTGPTTSTVFDPDTGRPFTIGGNQGPLPDEEQLAQLAWYMDQHHPEPDDEVERLRWLAQLPDRLTHAAMMMLGAAVDHSWPGTRLPADLGVEEAELGTLITPPDAKEGLWVVSVSPVPAGQARDMGWLPQAAALAHQAHATLLDVAEGAEVAQAVEWARQQGARTVVGYGATDSTPAITVHHELWDAMVLTLPHPDAAATAATWPRTLLQCPIGKAPKDLPPQVKACEYHVRGPIMTPHTARALVADAAAFLAS